MKCILETDRLVLKVLDEDSWKCVLNFLEKGRHIYDKYEAKKVPLYYTKMYQKGVLANESAATRGDRYVRYYVFLKEQPDVVIGTVSCGNIMSEPYSAGTLGYKFDEDYWHCGYATEAIMAMLNEVFTHLNLHRIIAYVMEGNEPSIKLLERLGFRLEGLCEKNLKVNGCWENHRMYAMLNPYADID